MGRSTDLYLKHLTTGLAEAHADVVDAGAGASSCGDEPAKLVCGCARCGRCVIIALPCRSVQLAHWMRSRIAADDSGVRSVWPQWTVLCHLTCASLTQDAYGVIQ
ncbi:hypothetical protein BD310DRAFT_162708 [Dichomitus squalens]|uniref:Uncharacterized protein n=1 Tax=Dichomitus squalens TaxID=114155 RepID=A0A4Q9PHS4_9APHY|nr:hypothetical protein BD310DRAFT_162708 [Dichomitus squalens]